MAGEFFSETNFVPESEPYSMWQQSGESRSSSPLGIGPTMTSVSDHELSPPVESSPCTTSTFCSAPLCRQFWKAGNYDFVPSTLTLPKGTSYLSIHPKFLHSNATSHKWPFGAIAELLDNAMDEVHNGATFAIMDKILNPRDGSPALLIQDDGGGMDPEAMRRCLSFGFSDKKSKVAIGQYGNGFKTSSMRLGSDVTVFSRHTKDRKLTQSIGLLSYTFLIQTGYDKIVVPMVDYEFNAQTNTWTSLNSAQHDLGNLSLLLQWSPYSSEDKLLKQLDDIDSHGTKIIIYNLWHTTDDKMELDFESDPQDIRISGQEERSGRGTSKVAATEQHLANRLRTSLRAYLSILYLRIPANFCILLRGQVIMYHNVATDLQFPECILYRPHSGAGSREAQVITTIGFLKDAPHVNVHGFNVYHKNRLILPFWHVVSYSSNRGRGVVGVLEANFIEPTHNKQDFEKTPALQKLEERLKDMTLEYWDFHCGLVGYQVSKKPKMMASQVPPDSVGHVLYQPAITSRDLSATSSAQSLPRKDLSSATSSAESLPNRDLSATSGAVSLPSAAAVPFQSAAPSYFLPDESRSGPLRREEHASLLEPEATKKKAGIEVNATVSNQENLPATDAASELNDQFTYNSIEENKKLCALCLEHEKRVEELNLKVSFLATQIEEAEEVYARLLAALKLSQTAKEESPM